MKTCENRICYIYICCIFNRFPQKIGQNRTQVASFVSMFSDVTQDKGSIALEKWAPSS